MAPGLGLNVYRNLLPEPSQCLHLEPGGWLAIAVAKRHPYPTRLHVLRLAYGCERADDSQVATGFPHGSGHRYIQPITRDAELSIA